MQEAARTARGIALAMAALAVVAAAARAQSGPPASPSTAADPSAPSPSATRAAAAAGHAGPSASARPVGGSSLEAASWHIVKRLDFDEARLGNEGELPMYWYRFKGEQYPDFPRYAAGYWDRQFGHNSRESFRLELNGGNVGYYYLPNSIAISPGQDIRVEAVIRTQGLRHARAILEVSLNDARGAVIPESRRRTPLLGGPGQNDRWLPVSMLVPGKFSAARYVNLSVFLLQPKRWEALDQATRDQPALINYIDVDGKAWIDDLTVYRLPRVTLTTGQPGQLLPAGQPGRVDVRIDGFANQPLDAELFVRDVAGRLIGHELFSSPGTERTPARQFQWRAPTLPAGLYQAELSLYAGGARLAGLPPLLTRQLRFAQLGPQPRRISRGRGFGLILSAPEMTLEEQPARDLADEQAQIVARLPVSLVKLPLWRAGQQLGQIDEPDPWTDQAIRQFVRDRVGLVGAFGQIPQRLRSDYSTRLGIRRTLLDVFSAEPSAWRPFLVAQLARYAEQVRYWQIGQEDAVSFAMDPRFVDTLGRVRREFRTLITAPTFVVSWPAMYAYGPPRPSGQSGPGDDHQPAGPRAISGPADSGFPAEIANLFVSSRISADAVDDYLREFVNLTQTRPWATLEPLEPAQYQREPRMADLAWRIVTAAAALAEPEAPAEMAGPLAGGNVFLACPWTLREASGSPLVEPTEELLIVHTAGNLLGGCRYGGTVRLADGVIGHIFDRGDGAGAMAVRNVGGDPAVPVQMYFGDKVDRVDLWGNRQPLPRAANDETQHLVTVGRLPFYLDGIDPRIARLRASFRLDPAFVPSSYKKHVRHVEFVNSFETPISGRLTLHFPDNWDVHPKVIPFSAQAGEVFRREIEIRFPYNAEAGVKPLIGDFVIDADRPYRIQVATRFDFGLGDVDVRTLTQWLPNDELLVTLNATNRSESRLDLFCFVVAPDRPRQERVIAGLPPGAAAVKSFRIPNARELIGQSLRVGLREVRGSRIVNYDVPVR